MCPSCGYVGQGTHPDLQLIEPVTYDEEGNPTPTDAINVERVRELIEFSQLSPHRQRAKVGLDRARGSDECGGGECIAQNARGAARGNISACW